MYYLMGWGEGYGEGGGGYVGGGVSVMNRQELGDGVDQACSVRCMRLAFLVSSFVGAGGC